MSMAKLTVVQAGPLTSIQGGPRLGFLRFGVPPSGPIDRIGHAAANLALGRDAAAPGIEMSLGGLVLHCEEGALDFALCGGDFTASIDDLVLGSWMAARIEAGQRLRVLSGRSGNWGYLSFAGRVRASEWLGSASTNVLAGLGGGRLVPGDMLTIEVDAGTRAHGPIAQGPPFRTDVRIVMGPQQRFFSDDDLQNLKSATFCASLSFDRMGILLDGPVLHPSSIAMVSEPAIRGALQIDGAGRMAMLLADHQTTAGYPKVATVLGCDTGSVTQASPETLLRFTPVEPAHAIAITRETVRLERAYLAEVAKGPIDFETRLRTANLVSGVQNANEG